MTPHEREVMQQALDALEQITPDWRTSIDKHEQLNNSIEALRTALAQPEKKWVGLTDDEYELMAEKRVTNYFFNTLDYAHDIEAKLKEKNNG
jgi:hypothetical protein